ncbi:Helicase associated domain protein [Streptomyces sp. NBC_01321]|uniref:DEAD/DEAH box helicase n=1 Tax=Streptomyces sp. NBC_01321 TaxID=2903825 RepID=UPI002E14697F|nr:Helicase associated domain protein [Streptomyces sp. NBC_01321]
MELREHQVAALAAIQAAVAAGEQRMTVASACGTGKTLVAQQAAQRLAPQGTVLVLMPTKALVTQTVRRWRQAGRTGPALAVCSLGQKESGLTRAEAVLCRGPRAVARTARTAGPVTVFSTYGSLHHIRDAHELYGLPPWDLVIIDEAHRTCSAFGDGWGTIHDDAAVPAKIRLYMTATPRVWITSAPTELLPLMERAPLATMDHREIFGPTVFELGMAEAIERGLLADYQVVMPVVDDADLHDILAARRPANTAHHDGLRNAAIQVAVLRAIAQHGLRRTLVFHNRIALAEPFAESLPITAQEAGEQLGIQELWSRVIHGEQPGDWRRDLLEDFADPDRVCAVLSNVRVLNEGVDMPDVDSVVFTAPRYSIIDAIQAIGRGLRQPPGAGKKTTLVIPVYLRHGLDTNELLKDSAFENLLTLLQALRAHDSSFMDRIALPARRQGVSAPARATHYARPERAAQLARALGLEITVPATGTWEESHTSAHRYRTSYGHLDVPAHYTDPDGFALGECVANLRLRHLLGRLPAEHKQALDALGMVWATPTRSFESMLEHARVWAAEFGDLGVPVKEKRGGHPVGSWLATQRHKAKTGRLSPEHRQALEAIDPDWDQPSTDWQRRYIRARTLITTTGWTPAMLSTAPRPGHHTTVNWVLAQRVKFFQLQPRQQELLISLGIPPWAYVMSYNHAYDPDHHAFYAGLAHAAEFLNREGHLDVPRRHREPAPRSHTDTPAFALGHWIHQCRKHPEALTPEQRRALEALRMVWNPALRARRRPGPPPA